MGQGYSLGLFGGIRFALAVKAGGKAHAGQAALFQAVQKGIHLDGVDRAGAGALVPRCLGKVANHGNFCALGQRQQVVLVFQQHNAFGCGAAGQGVVSVRIKGAAVGLHGGMGIKHQRQQLVQPGVHIRFGNFAALHSLHQLAHRVPAGGGHFQRGAVLHAQSMVIAAAPVRYHSAVKAPLPAQDVH